MIRHPARRRRRSCARLRRRRPPVPRLRPMSSSGTIGSAVAETRTSLATVFRNQALRRLNLALAGSMIGDWAYATAVMVWAYGVGGATAVGIFVTVKYGVSAIGAPFTSALADRMSRRTLMVGCDLVRAVVIAGAAALVEWEGPEILVFGLAVAGRPGRHGVPAGAARPDPVAGRRAGRADRGQRRRQHHREPGLLRRTGARRLPARRRRRGHGHPPQRRDVRLVGRAGRGGAPATEAAAAGDAEHRRRSRCRRRRTEPHEPASSGPRLPASA